MNITVENILDKGLDAIIDFLIELLELDIQELISLSLTKELSDDDIVCKRFNSFIEYLSPSEKNEP